MHLGNSIGTQVRIAELQGQVSGCPSSVEAAIAQLERIVTSGVRPICIPEGYRPQARLYTGEWAAVMLACYELNRVEWARHHDGLEDIGLAMITETHEGASLVVDHRDTTSDTIACTGHHVPRPTVLYLAHHRSSAALLELTPSLFEAELARYLLTPAII
eukprot:jgi/Chlat1/7692/Chrsp64S09162